ncbi:MAG: cellulase family glycosylhydrolase [Planctomycetes bacterium]|nr:cellulase family glycosylhydrolase [Planctomycetota bacterium]
MNEFSRFRFGVNYVPSSDWYYMWNAFCADTIKRDIDTITEIHADHIRLQLIWPWFMPNATWVCPAHLERLDHVMDIARERSVDVCICALDGHLSGLQFVPGYMIKQGFMNSPRVPRELFFTSQEIREIQKRYFSSLAAIVNCHENFLGFDLGNEINCCWSTGSDTDAGDTWLEDMLSYVEKLSPGKVHVCGVDHLPWFTENTFSPEKLATRQELATLHTWTRFTGAVDKDKPLSPHCTKLAAACTRMAKAYARDINKPVWIQEFGASKEWMCEKDMPEFLEKSIIAAVEAGACWFTWWASHDINGKFRFDPLEYDLGLIDTDNNIKEHGKAFRRLADILRRETPRTLSGECPPPPESRNMERTWAWLENEGGILPR